MHIQFRKLVSKGFLDAYLKYKAGNEKAFDNFLLNSFNIKVIEELFNTICIAQGHIVHQQTC